METKNHDDSFTKKLTLTTNDPDRPTVLITCQGKLLIPARVEPKRLLFGKLYPHGPPQTKRAKIFPADGGSFVPALIPVKTPGLAARIIPVDGEDAYEVEVTVTPAYLTDSLRHGVFFKTGIQEAPVAKVTVFGKLIPRLQVTPKNFALPVNRDQEAERFVRLVWSENKPAQIVSVSTNVPGAQATWTEANGAQYVRLTVPPVSVDNAITYVVHIATADPHAPELQVPVEFIVQQEEKIRIDGRIPTRGTNDSN